MAYYGPFILHVHVLTFIVLQWVFGPASLGMTQWLFERSHMNESFPLLKVSNHSTSLMTCSRACIADEKCHAMNKGANNKECIMFGDERYFVNGTYVTMLVTGPLWIAQRGCPEPYELVAGGCFYPVPGSMDWYSAKSTCESMHHNGRLAEFHGVDHGAEVMNAVVSHLSAFGVAVPQILWVGGKELQNDSVEWVTTRKVVSTSLWFNPVLPQGDMCTWLWRLHGKLFLGYCGGNTEGLICETY